jgi:hypothetical protein
MRNEPAEVGDPTLKPKDEPVDVRVHEYFFHVAETIAGEVEEITPASAKA